MLELIQKIQEHVILYAILRVILVLIATYVVKSLVNRAFDLNIKNRIISDTYQSKTNTVFSILKNLTNIVIYFLSITFILNIFNINTTSILAVAGVGGMALAFAAKSIVEDVITGAFILVEDQFNIGDLIQINGITGTVFFMGIRLTKLRDIDGREIIIPNSKIGTVINYSINDMRASVIINISSKKNIDFILTSISKGIEKSKAKFSNYTVEPTIIGIDGFTDYSYKVLVAGHTKNGEQWEAQRVMRNHIILELQNENIDFSSIKFDK